MVFWEFLQMQNCNWNTLAHLQVTFQSHDMLPYVWIDAPYISFSIIMAYKQIIAILDLNKRVMQLCIKRERGFQKPWQIFKQSNRGIKWRKETSAKVETTRWYLIVVGKRKKKTCQNLERPPPQSFRNFVLSTFQSIDFLKSVMETRLPSVIPKKKGCGKIVCIIHGSLFCANKFQRRDYVPIKLQNNNSDKARAQLACLHPHHPPPVLSRCSGDNRSPCSCPVVWIL